MNSRAISVQQHKSLTIVQLLTSNQNTFDYISGPRAIREEMIEVKEVSQSGSVNDLFVFNLSKNFVFFMDGDILSGAKQNRVINTSVLLAPNSKTTIPVSCVEQGRWNHLSDKFSDTDYSAPAVLRAKKAKAVKDNLSTKGKFYGKQGEVWDDVDSYSFYMNFSSPTSNLSDVFNAKKDTFEKFLSNFKLEREANGIAMFVNKKLLCVDVFNRTDIYAEYFPKLLKSAAMDVFSMKDDKEIVTENEAVFKSIHFLDKFAELDFENYPGVGVGIEKRFDSNEITGFELNYDDNMIHLTALNTSDEGGRKNDTFRRNRIF